MKQGSTDDPFADDPVDEGPDESGGEADGEGGGEGGDETGDPAADGTPAVRRPTGEGPDRTGDAAADETDGSVDETATGEGGSAPQQHSLPYIHARDGVKDGRTQRPVFLRDEVEAGIDDLVARMESEFGEDVYKTDVTEAAMAVAQEHPDLVRAKLEEWGYGWT